MLHIVLYFATNNLCSRCLKLKEFDHVFYLESVFCQVQQQLGYSVVHKSQNIRIHSGKPV